MSTIVHSWVVLVAFCVLASSESQQTTAPSLEERKQTRFLQQEPVISSCPSQRCPAACVKLANHCGVRKCQEDRPCSEGMGCFFDCPCGHDSCIAHCFASRGSAVSFQTSACLTSSAAATNVAGGVMRSSESSTLPKDVVPNASVTSPIAGTTIAAQLRSTGADCNTYRIVETRNHGKECIQQTHSCSCGGGAFPKYGIYSGICFDQGYTVYKSYSKKSDGEGCMFQTTKYTRPQTAALPAVPSANLAFQHGHFTCLVIKEACSHLFKAGVTSIARCKLEDAEVVAACEAVGLGPEDPLADTCSGILGSTVADACAAAIREGGSFTGSKCQQAAGCSSLVNDVVVV